MQKTTRQQRTLKRPPRIPRLKKASAVPRPVTPFPGYMSDEWLDYLLDRIPRIPPAQVRATLIKAGIHDENGQLTKPYRS